MSWNYGQEGPIGTIVWKVNGPGANFRFVDSDVNLVGTATLRLGVGGQTNTTTSVFEVDDSSGNIIMTVRPVIPETPTASQNTLYVAGQQPSTMTASVDSYVAHIRGWGRGSSTAAGQSALRVHFPLGAGGETFTTNYTGNQLAAAINAQTDSTSTGITPVSGYVGNAAVAALATGITAGWNVGVIGRAQKSTGTNVGVLGYAIGSANSEVWNIGVLGVARQASQISNSGYFYAGIIEPSTAPAASSVLAVDSAATAVNLINLLFNGGNVAVVNSRGHWTLTPTATAGGVTTLSSTPGAHTAVVAEVFDYNYAAHTMTITGGYAAQRFAFFAQPTISAGSALTVTQAATVAIANAPAVAASAIITNTYALWVQAGLSSFGGAQILGHATAAINSTNTATAAQTATGYITSTSAAPTTITLPTAALLGPAIGAAQGTIFYLTIDNTAGASTVTIVSGANITPSALATAFATSAGLLTVPSGVTGQGTFQIQFSSATVATYTRVA